MTGTHPLAWGLAWIFVTALLFMLPLVPAFAELRKGRDVAPVPIDDLDNGETAYRIETLAPRLPELASLEHARSWLQGQTYVLPEGAKLPPARTDSAVRLLAGSAANVLVSRQNVDMDGGSEVRHLLHAACVITHGPVILSGRTSADRLIILAAGSHAFRLAAPCICTAPLTAAPAANTPAHKPTPLTRIPERHGGDLQIKPGETRIVDLVVSGTLSLGEGATIIGHVKAHGDIELAPGASVVGALFAGRDIRCRGSNHLQGPVSAARRVELGTGTQAGSAEIACSVSGWEVLLGPSVAVFGAIASVDGCRAAAEPS